MKEIIELSNLMEKLADSLLREEKAYIEHSELANISITQLHYIDLIYHAEHPSLSDCAKILGVSKPSVTITIDKLVELGFVARIKSDADRRSSHLHLTQEGMKLAQIHDEFHHAYTYKMFGQLPDADIQILLSILGKVFNKI